MVSPAPPVVLGKKVDGFPWECSGSSGHLGFIMWVFYCCLPVPQVSRWLGERKNMSLFVEKKGELWRGGGF